MDPKAIRAAARRHKIRADKRLSQHFLVSKRVIDRILNACDGCASVLEIGPGPGILTAPLSSRLLVVAVEADPRMEPVLAETAPEAEVLIADALKVPLVEIANRLEAPVALVSNMPYSITGPLLERACMLAPHIDRAILMMQKEVAIRALAPAGDRHRGSLTVALEARFDVSTVCQAPPEAFDPPPKVSSTVLLMKPHGLVPDHELEGLDQLLRNAFRHPRKTLGNNLGAKAERLEALGFAPKVRPHQLALDDFRRLVAEL